jgi:hypothetical protein
LDEPDDVKKSRNEVARIKREFSHLFVGNKFGQSILSEQQIQLDDSTDALNVSMDKGLHRFEAFPPRTPTANGYSLLSAEKQASVSLLNRFNDLLPRLAPSVQRIVSTPVPSSPYICHDSSRIIRNSGIKSKDLDRLNRLTTPQSVRTQHEKRATMFRDIVNSRKRQFTEQDDGLHIPPNNSSKIKTPTSILRGSSSKQAKIIGMSIFILDLVNLFFRCVAKNQDHGTGASAYHSEQPPKVSNLINYY